MSDFGIICEVNPLHNGHKYLIDKAREKGASRVVCVMSGNTVQRGEFAVADKYVRAETLIKCGADLVLELPFPWCSGSAEFFSTVGIEIIKNFCDTIIFGSECGDIDILKEAANAASSDEFRNEYFNKLTDGAQSTGLYFDMLCKHTGHNFMSNDLLGIEYIRADKKLSASLNFVTIQRVGDAYLSSSINDKHFPSATAIRDMWQNGDFSETEKYIPKEAFSVYEKAISEKNICDVDELDVFWLSFFRLLSTDYFDNIVGADGGLGNRLCASARRAHSTDELLNLVKNKRYTDSSIRRTMLYCLAGVTNDDLSSLPTETLLLAANDKGRELISEKRRSNIFKIVTKPADLDRELKQNILSDRINAVYSLAFNEKKDADEYLRKKPFIDK